MIRLSDSPLATVTPRALPGTKDRACPLDEFVKGDWYRGRIFWKTCYVVSGDVSTRGYDVKPC